MIKDSFDVKHQRSKLLCKKIYLFMRLKLVGLFIDLKLRVPTNFYLFKFWFIELSKNF
jgi:hypothetical protein